MKLKQLVLPPINTTCTLFPLSSLVHWTTLLMQSHFSSQNQRDTNSPPRVRGGAGGGVKRQFAAPSSKSVLSSTSLERALSCEVAAQIVQLQRQLPSLPPANAQIAQRRMLPAFRCTLRHSPSQPPKLHFANRQPPVFPPILPTAILQFANLLHIYVFYSSLIPRHFFLLSTQYSALSTCF